MFDKIITCIFFNHRTIFVRYFLIVFDNLDTHEHGFLVLTLSQGVELEEEFPKDLYQPLLQ